MIDRKKLESLFCKDEEGATLMEFGLVVGPLMMILLGVTDLGYQGYLDTLAKSKLHEISRQASTGALTVTQIEQKVEEELKPLLLKGVEPKVFVKSYFDFTSIGKPEKLLTDDNGDGNLDPGDCYLDGNRNGEFDVNFGNSGTGGPDDIVSYTIEIESPRLFPLAKMFGWSETMKTTNTTAVRNQPYGDQTDVPEICEPIV
ncbi:MAG: TadE family protein [Parasphingorhabdus sp.]|uniref:TadE/TadG family type IV pilus assembly protein n=1 Tax=Parasphingorhabdus sp. TaxID=2709688 RepID=UPI0032998BAB